MKSSQFAGYHNQRCSLSLCHVDWEKIPFFSEERFSAPIEKFRLFFVSNLKNRIFHCIIGLRTHKSMSNFFFSATKNFSNAPFCLWKLFGRFYRCSCTSYEACLQLDLAVPVFPCVFDKVERKIKTRRGNFFFGSAIHQFLL